MQLFAVGATYFSLIFCV